MIQRKQFKRTALALAIAVAASGTVLAQSSQGYIFGQVSGSGSVTVENLGTGQTREIAADADGNYRASSLPTGKYKVSYNGQTREVTVNAGSGAAASFAAEGTTLTTIEVSGSAVNPIDVSSVESTTVLTEAQIDAVPIPRNVTAVALLAPGTVRGDNAFGNLASFGGSSVAENAYFVNGFNVTNIVTGLAFSELPFEGISEQQVKTGGYGAEFGRSLGGVINIQTKRGTNEWKFGASTYWAPDSLRESTRVVNNGDGTFDRDSFDSHSDSLTVNLYAGGPVIEDRLFFFALLQSQTSETNGYGANTSFYQENDNPQGMLKLDWNISDNHLLEFTGFKDTTTSDSIDYRSTVDYQENHGTQIGTSQTENGGENYILKYTGYLTDNFTLSALAGRGEYQRFNLTSSGACPIAIDARVPPNRVIGCWNPSAPFVQPGDAGDVREAIRIDADWALGDHTVRFGYDQEEFATVDGSRYSGGIQWRYLSTAPGRVLANGAVVPAGVTQVVRSRVFENGGSFLTKNSAWYVEDTWQATDNFLVYGGIRNEAFENLNSLGGAFIDIKNTWAPRLGFAWDVNGDSSLKVFGNAGRYFIPVYANTNVRLAGSELDYQEFYTFTAIDPITGVPTLGTQIGTRRVTTDGVVPNPLEVVDNAIDPLFQDEFILGFQLALADNWAIGTRAIHRDLGAGMDDICSGVFAEGWALDNGYSATEAANIAAGIDHCFLTNPGQDLDGNFDLAGDGVLTRILIPASALGNPEATRKYNALEFFFERAWDDKWFLQGSWTIAHSYGNTEGYVKSDNGQDDAGITQDFDYPGLTEGSYGDLPNDRRHSFKVFGSYQLTDEWRVGANALVQSGRPRNCFGIYNGTSDPAAVAYGVASFYCDVTDDGVNNGVLTPRGSLGRNPWVRQLDLQVNYKPAWAEGLAFTMDAVNIFNADGNYSSQENGEEAGGEPRSDHLFPSQLQGGRFIRFGVGYDF